MPDQLVPARNRVSFAKLDEVLPLPDLVAIQRESFDWLLNEGIKEVLEEVSPIEDFTEQFQLYFGRHEFREQKFSEEECRDKDITFSRPLFVEATFVNKVTGEIKEQEVFMGDFPMMTDHGTFIINGTERVVVSQLVRSPGVYFSRELDKTTDKDVFIAKIIPGRGAWLEFDVDKKDTVGVRIDRKRRQNVTVMLKALGWSEDEILKLFNNAPSIQLTLEKDHVETQEEALEDIYRKLRPGEPPTAESAKTLLENLFFNPKRYDLAKVGRHKVDKKLGPAEGELLEAAACAPQARAASSTTPTRRPGSSSRYRVLAPQAKDEPEPGAPKYKGILTYEDMLKTVAYLVKLHAGAEGYDPDDIDHFGNRRLRVGRRADPEPDPDRALADGARGQGAHDDPGRRGDHAADVDQHPTGRGIDQGVLRDVAAVAVHGPDQHAVRAHASPAPFGAWSRRSVPRAGGVRGP